MTFPIRLLAAVGGLLLGLVLLLTAAATAVLPTAPAFDCAGPQDSLRAAAGEPPLDSEQVRHAATITGVARDRGLPPRAAVIAVATAYQESKLHNLDHGHLDSVGLFQQRPSQGWGTTPADPDDQRTPARRVRDPVYAATVFYGALVQVPHWRQLPLTEAAQAVQRSATPHAYAQWEPLATRTVAALTAPDCLTTTNSGAGPAAHAAIDFAWAHLGLPYLWGGNGPTPTNPRRGYDCSGLTKAAYAAAGITIPRTAQTQYNAGPRLPPGVPLRPGDLVFYGTSPRNITHVGLYIGDNKMINAPRTGAHVRIEDYRWDNFIGASRPAD